MTLVHRWVYDWKMTSKTRRRYKVTTRWLQKTRICKNVRFWSGQRYWKHKVVTTLLRRWPTPRSKVDQNPRFWQCQVSAGPLDSLPLGFFIVDLNKRESLLCFYSNNKQSKRLYSQYIVFHFFFRGTSVKNL